MMVGDRQLTYVESGKSLELNLNKNLLCRTHQKCQKARVTFWQCKGAMEAKCGLVADDVDIQGHYSS